MLGTGAGHANMQLSGSRSSKSGSVALKLLLLSDVLRNWFKSILLGPTWNFWLSRSWIRLYRNCVSNKFPCDAIASGPGTTLWETLVYYKNFRIYRELGPTVWCLTLSTIWKLCLRSYKLWTNKLYLRSVRAIENKVHWRIDKRKLEFAQALVYQFLLLLPCSFWDNKRDYINPNIAWKRIHCLDFI